MAHIFHLVCSFYSLKCIPPDLYSFVWISNCLYSSGTTGDSQLFFHDFYFLTVSIYPFYSWSIQMIFLNVLEYLLEFLLNTVNCCLRVVVKYYFRSCPPAINGYLMRPWTNKNIINMDLFLTELDSYSWIWLFRHYVQLTSNFVDEFS